MPDPHRTILITGASKGIGRAVSEMLASRGYSVIGIARTLEGVSFPGTLISCDLADAAQTERVLADIADRYAVDGVVNNAGLVGPQELGAIDMGTLHSVLDLNIRVAVQVTQALVGGMKVRGFGRIVSMTSRAIYGARERTAYSAAKAALIGCTRTWALELADHGITANAVAPGPVETDLFRKPHPSGSAEEARIIASIPMHRLGTPEDVAGATCFLLSEDAGFVTGQVLAVDGGGSLEGR